MRAVIGVEQGGADHVARRPAPARAVAGRARGGRGRVLATTIAPAVMLLLSACGPRQEGVVGAPPATEPPLQIIVPPIVAVDAANAPNRNGVAFARTDDGVVLPARATTPGAWFDDVTAADVCEPHYSQGVRQPRFNDKVEAFAGYGVSIRDRDVYLVDHLVPISLGGSNAIENLWPQPLDGVAAAREKDALERQLRGLVCSGSLDLATARHAISSDWWAAYDTYMGLPIAPGTEGPVTWLPDDGPGAGAVENGAPCAVEGEVGYTEPKRVRLTCTATGFGELRWAKRY